MERTVFPMKRTRFSNADEERIYFEVHHLLIKLAVIACRNSGIQLEELRSEADLLFVEALRTYQKDKGVKFSTFLYVVVHNGLIDYGRQLNRHYNLKARALNYVNDDGEEVDLFDRMSDPVSDRYYNLFDDLSSLTEDGQQLAEAALCGFGSSIGKLRELATKRMNFSHDRFESACRELRQVVNAWT